MDLFQYAQDKKEKQKKDAPTVQKPPYAPAPSEKTVLSVSQLSNQLRMLVEGKFASIAVEGEISGLMRAASGHMYFDLKDKDNLIKCIMWRGSAEKLKVALADGMQVVVRGKVTTYGARSTYQITVSRLEPAGVGALMQKFEETKARLSEEGLFDDANKQAIPFLPKKIGIITSPTGAVIEDMLHRIEDRFPRHIMLYPTLVQGVGAKEQIATGINYFHELAEGEKPDVLIVARGGGSLEDLWAFNEEVVVRAIAHCSIPVISAVGHEPDVTLCDFVADLRAPTPTAAAEMVVPVRADLIYTLSLHNSKLEQSMLNTLAMLKKHVHLMQKALPDPQSTLAQMKMRLDDRVERLRLGLKTRFIHSRQRLDMLTKRMSPEVLRIQLMRQQERFGKLNDRLNGEIVLRQIKQREELLMRQKQLLESYSPEGPLKRGYVYLTDQKGEVMRSKAQGTEGASMKAHFADGTRDVTLGACDD